MSDITGLPDGWEVRHSNSKNLPYYFNASTKESRWEPPSGTDPEKLKAYMATYHSGPSGIAGLPAEGKIRCAHLLVKHRDSRRPSSWRENNITRSKEEAIEILRGHEQRIKSGEIRLADLAVSESDCSSARKKGDLGFFGRGEMQKEFEDAAFALKPGEISSIVESPSGVHLIERYVDRPEDWYHLYPPQN
ncbi:Peptidyl-prolyl cis-trans isomerase ssp-1 [Talaromyces atroroseus]|uniref:Peptidyl-prolyl cis-trans isomerase n=1 Tax=Talaromyces atroroseus TaxID=1441469 RepID=A0A225B0Y7_TALAT|nr:Peptidyl-prolyl cis-trans isomerase ssp-1 [Talaromyces atroroseus]OKL61639.1 Peptidyl-prolyl cis-trans isomerase ssp-1 [Talaromyces atroroseus]